MVVRAPIEPAAAKGLRPVAMRLAAKSKICRDPDFRVQCRVHCIPRRDPAADRRLGLIGKRHRFGLKIVATVARLARTICRGRADGPESPVRRGLAAGGSGIRTVGPPKMDKAPEIARRAFSRFHSSERLTVRFRASDGSNPASSGSKSVSWCAATSRASRDRAAITGVALKNVPAVRVKAAAR